MFVKANSSGSSYGISKVYNVKELEIAVKKSFEFDDEVLVEQFLNGKEVSVGVMNYENEIKVFGITEIITTNDFFDYEAKYEGKHEEISPARINKIQKDYFINQYFKPNIQIDLSKHLNKFASVKVC